MKNLKKYENPKVGYKYNIKEKVLIHLMLIIIRKSIKYNSFVDSYEFRITRNTFNGCNISAILYYFNKSMNYKLVDNYLYVFRFSRNINPKTCLQITDIFNIC
jgi:hypothetical protein